MYGPAYRIRCHIYDIVQADTRVPVQEGTSHGLIALVLSGEREPAELSQGQRALVNWAFPTPLPHFRQRRPAKWCLLLLRKGAVLVSAINYAAVTRGSGNGAPF
ncbi:hypothetical protein MRX96_036143 [Rhipicephalus microplus]